MPLTALLLAVGLVLIAAVAAQQVVISPTNTTHYTSTPFYLVTYCSGLLPIPVIPLTVYALNNPPRPAPDGLSSLVLAGPDVSNPELSSGTVAYIPCDAAPYTSGSLTLAGLVNTDVSQVSAILLYSLDYKYCNVTAAPGNYPLYSMTSIPNANTLLSIYSSTNTSLKPAVNIVPSNYLVNGSRTTCHGTNTPKVPSVEPTTAFAMIILYSVTGVITMLFLLIIIMGAIRAHRNPEQYGPRDILGRPRQSRAKGIARAMLDTIPIVKFGEHNSDEKPADIELNAATPSPEVADATRDISSTKKEMTDATPVTAESNPVVRSSVDLVTEDGPAPIVPAAGPSLSPNVEDNIEHGLVCSICTEEFERGEDTRVLPCNHKYHPACVDPWLLNVSGTCPLCRIELCPPTAGTGEDGEEETADTADVPAAESNVAAAEIPAARRRSTIRTLLFERGRMQRATPEERIATLRQYREQQQARVLANAATRIRPNQRPRYRSLRGPW